MQSKKKQKSPSKKDNKKN